MSICRFLDYRCDLYIYESAQGIECHVAANRRVDEPKEPDWPICRSDDDEAVAQYFADYREFMSNLEACEIVKIGLPYDGDWRTFAEWSELLEYVLMLKETGYWVPDWVIESIREEVTEEDAGG